MGRELCEGISWLVTEGRDGGEGEGEDGFRWTLRRALQNASPESETKLAESAAQG